MRQLNTSYHNEMAGYLMDFGFGGFVGYGGGVLVGLVKNGGGFSDLKVQSVAVQSTCGLWFMIKGSGFMATYG